MTVASGLLIAQQTYGMESMLRQRTKRFPGLSEVSYSYRLALLALESLKLRRIRRDLILAYKIVFGVVDEKSTNYFSVNTEIRSLNCEVDLLQNTSNIHVHVTKSY
jgi:hypothetical protein